MHICNRNYLMIKHWSWFSSFRRYEVSSNITGKGVWGRLERNRIHESWRSKYICVIGWRRFIKCNLGHTVAVVDMRWMVVWLKIGGTEGGIEDGKFYFVGALMLWWRMLPIALASHYCAGQVFVQWRAIPRRWQLWNVRWMIVLISHQSWYGWCNILRNYSFLRSICLMHSVQINISSIIVEILLEDWCIYQRFVLLDEIPIRFITDQGRRCRSIVIWIWIASIYHSFYPHNSTASNWWWRNNCWVTFLVFSRNVL